MKKNLVSLALLCAGLMGSSAFALNAHGNGKYGVAGCGLGSLLFHDNDAVSQILAATTNGTSGNQTFGITSGTSNCGTGVNVSLQRQKDFMTANLVSLQREVAQGTGETVAGLAYVLGCDDSDYQAFGAYSQSRYAEVFNSSSPEAVLVNLKEELKKDKALSQSCTLAFI